jgi:HD-like signal output (HDOD) protein
MTEPIRAPKRRLQSPDEIVKDLHELPSVPAILPRLLTILGDTSATMEDVLSLIKVEPGIAARVLQLGNSAYYSHGGRCSGLEEGVNRIGFQKIYEVVAYAVSSQLLLRTLTSYGIEPNELWLRSVGCAIASAMLAPACGLDVDGAYTTGLFHAVGLVGIDAWLKANESSAALEYVDFPTETTESEKQLIGFSNASIAAALLRSWTFKSSVCEAVHWQYSPKSAGANRRAASLLQVAKWVQAKARLSPVAKPPAQPDISVFSEIRLAMDDIELRVEEVRTELERASLMLVET